MSHSSLKPLPRAALYAVRGILLAAAVFLLICTFLSGTIKSLTLVNVRTVKTGNGKVVYAERASGRFEFQKAAKVKAGGLSSDGAERVYVPLASDAGETALLRDLFVFSADKAEVAQMVAERRASLLTEGIPVDDVRNHADTLGMIAQNGRLQWFFLTVSAAAALIVLGTRRLIAAYGFEIGRREALLCAGLIVAGLAVVVLSAFKPIFPQGLLTSAGRIDPAHIFRLFLADAKAVNGAGADFWARYGHRVLGWSCGLCAGAAGTAGMAAIHLGVVISKKIPLK